MVRYKEMYKKKEIILRRENEKTAALQRQLRGQEDKRKQARAQRQKMKQALANADGPSTRKRGRAGEILGRKSQSRLQPHSISGTPFLFQFSPFRFKFMKYTIPQL